MLRNPGTIFDLLMHEMKSKETEKQMPIRECDRNLLATLALAEEMLTLADKGDLDREDESCGVLYAFLRDAGYKLFKLARNEKESHIGSGKWKFGKNENEHGKKRQTENNGRS